MRSASKRLATPFNVELLEILATSRHSRLLRGHWKRESKQTALEGADREQEGAVSGACRKPIASREQGGQCRATIEIDLIGRLPTSSPLNATSSTPNTYKEYLRAYI